MSYKVVALIEDVHPSHVVFVFGVGLRVHGCTDDQIQLLVTVDVRSGDGVSEIGADLFADCDVLVVLEVPSEQQHLKMDDNKCFKGSSEKSREIVSVLTSLAVEDNLVFLMV